MMASTGDGFDFTAGGTGSILRFDLLREPAGRRLRPLRHGRGTFRGDLVAGHFRPEEHRVGIIGLDDELEVPDVSTLDLRRHEFREEIGTRQIPDRGARRPSRHHRLPARLFDADVVLTVVQDLDFTGGGAHFAIVHPDDGAIGIGGDLDDTADAPRSEDEDQTEERHRDRSGSGGVSGVHTSVVTGLERARKPSPEPPAIRG